MGLIGQIKTALTLKRAADRLQEEAKVGHLKTALYGVGSAVVTAAAAAFLTSCPALATQWGSILTAGVLGAAAYAVQRPTTAPTFKAVATAVGGAALAAGVVKFEAVCPGLYAQAPVLLSTAVMTGLGHWLESPHAPAEK